MVTVDAGQRTRRLAIVLASASMLLAGASLPAAYATGDNGNEDRGNRRLDATLTGAKEIPGPGDPDGRGKAQIRLKQDQICFDLAWRNIDAPTAAHIHVGAPDVAGPIVLHLFGVPAPGLGAPVSSVGGCATPDDPGLIADLRNNPRGYYVNIHNVAFPAGAIRGQLHR